MGLFDKLIGKKIPDDKTATDLAKADQEASLSEQSNIEKAIAERNAGIDLEQFIKIPFGDIAALGTTFSQIIPSLRTMTATGVGYIPVNMAPGEMLKSAGKGLYYGAHISADGKSVMTKFMQNGPVTSVMPINPAMIMIAVVLATIEKKLDTIQETQIKILSFLEQDKQAEQQGNLNVLTDILQGYKHNWDNAQYLQNHHMKVLDIKQTSEKNIIFYQEQIASVIKRIPAIYMDQAVKGAITDLGKLFRNYRMALYLFAFSSFLEVLLLGNFRQEYLDQIAAKVEEYNELYRTQLIKCHDMIKKLSADSVETKVLAGIGNASKAFGKLISSSPILAKGSVDDWFQDSGDKLLQGNVEKVANTVAMFNVEDRIGSEIFIDNIKNVGIISNKTTEILFDKDTLYLAGN